MKIIFNREIFDVDVENTLADFVRAYDASNLPGVYTMNGELKAGDEELFNYCMIERSSSYDDDSDYIINEFDEPEDDPEVEDETLVNIHLIDFTGFAQFVDVPKSVSKLSERYSQQIIPRIYRGSAEVVDGEFLSGDRVIVTPAGGVKGA